MKPYGILKYITGGDKWKLTTICMTEIKKNQKKLVERYDRLFIKKCYQIES